MGLDIYVGALTRYYLGQWETVVQQWGREQGHQVDLVRQHDPADAITDPDEVRPIVEDWRAGLESGIRGHADVSLDWPEGLDTPYFTDKPTWDCYGALLLWADIVAGTAAGAFFGWLTASVVVGRPRWRAVTIP